MVPWMPTGAEDAQQYGSETPQISPDNYLEASYQLSHGVQLSRSTSWAIGITDTSSLEVWGRSSSISSTSSASFSSTASKKSSHSASFGPPVSPVSSSSVDWDVRWSLGGGGGSWSSSLSESTIEWAHMVMVEMHNKNPDLHYYSISIADDNPLSHTPTPLPWSLIFALHHHLGLRLVTLAICCYLFVVEIAWKVASISCATDWIGNSSHSKCQTGNFAVTTFR